MKADQREARVSAARLANPKEKRIPYAEVRKRAGLWGLAATALAALGLGLDS